MKTLPLFLALLLTTSCFGGVVPGPVPPTVHTITTTNYVLGNTGVLVWDGSNLWVTNDLGGIVITNIYIQIIVVSNIVAGNIQGPTNRLAMFTPDDFGLGASIAYQTGVDSVTFNGTGNPFIGMGPTNGYYCTLEAIATNLTVSLGGGMVVTNGVLAADSTLGINLGGVIRTTWPTSLAINPTPGYLPYNNAGSFSDSPLSVTATNLVVEFGGVNAIQLDDTRLYLTNGGKYATMQNNSGNLILFSSDGITQLRDATITTKHLTTLVDNTYDIGANSDIGAYKDFYQKGKHYIQGMNDGAGNYSRLAISHTGTNNTDNVLINSASSGTAGTVARPIQFQMGGTNNFKIKPERTVRIPQMTKAEKTAIAAPEEGDLVFQTDNTPGLRVYQSGAWMMVSTVADP